jgi:hypothetical protein
MRRARKRNKSVRPSWQGLALGWPEFLVGERRGDRHLDHDHAELSALLACVAGFCQAQIPALAAILAASADLMA